MPETRNVVVLGASYAGGGIAHYMLKHVLPKLPSTATIKYQVILVDPSSKWFSRTTSPRALSGPGRVPDHLLFIDTASGFKQYGDRVQFVQGKAVSWDPEARTVTVQKSAGDTQVTPYFALVLATGTKAAETFTLQGADYHVVQDAIRKIHEQLPSAKRIVVAGGGPTGVETAGQLAEARNGSPGWFSSRPAHPEAEVMLLTSSSQLLTMLKPAAAEKAEKQLARVGVEVRYNTKITSTRVTESGKTAVTLHDGSEILADMYISAIGTTPMTEYVPKRLLTGKGFVQMNEQTLRVDAAGPRVYAVGDVGSYTNKDIMYVLGSVPVAASNLERDLLAAHQNPSNKPTGADRHFAPAAGVTQLVPVGNSKGVGALFGWGLPSFAVWLIKGRDYMMGKGPSYVDGGAWASESKWKSSAA